MRLIKVDLSHLKQRQKHGDQEWATKEVEKKQAVIFKLTLGLGNGNTVTEERNAVIVVEQMIETFLLLAKRAGQTMAYLRTSL